MNLSKFPPSKHLISILSYSAEAGFDFALFKARSNIRLFLAKPCVGGLF